MPKHFTKESPETQIFCTWVAPLFRGVIFSIGALLSLVLLYFDTTMPLLIAWISCGILAVCSSFALHGWMQLISRLVLLWMGSRMLRAMNTQSYLFWGRHSRYLDDTLTQHATLDLQYQASRPYGIGGVVVEKLAWISATSMIDIVYQIVTRTPSRLGLWCAKTRNQRVLAIGEFKKPSYMRILSDEGDIHLELEDNDRILRHYRKIERNTLTPTFEKDQ